MALPTAAAPKPIGSILRAVEDNDLSWVPIECTILPDKGFDRVLLGSSPDVAGYTRAINAHVDGNGNAKVYMYPFVRSVKGEPCWAVRLITFGIPENKRQRGLSKENQFKIGNLKIDYVQPYMRLSNFRLAPPHKRTETEVAHAHKEYLVWLWQKIVKDLPPPILKSAKKGRQAGSMGDDTMEGGAYNEDDEEAGNELSVRPLSKKTESKRALSPHDSSLPERPRRRRRTKRGPSVPERYTARDSSDDESLTIKSEDRKGGKSAISRSFNPFSPATTAALQENHILQRSGSGSFDSTHILARKHHLDDPDAAINEWYRFEQGKGVFSDDQLRMAAQGYKETHGEPLPLAPINMTRVALQELAPMKIYVAKPKVQETSVWKACQSEPERIGSFGSPRRAGNADHSDSDSVQEIDDPRPPKAPTEVVDLEMEIAQKEATALLDGPVPITLEEARKLLSDLDALDVARNAQWRGSKAVQEALVICYIEQ